jgi:two-component system chemotaxis response regulator CheB
VADGGPNHSSRDIVVVGASAGGVEALGALFERLPRDVAAAIFVVLHISPTGLSVLPQILTRVGPFPAVHASDEDTVRPGRIVVAPPDRHLVLERGRVRVTAGPRENGHRPAIDPLFRSAAAAYGDRVVGIVLSGSLDDGTAGLLAIKAAAGLTIAQDPEQAAYPSMPTAAIAAGAADMVLGLEEMAATVAALTSEPNQLLHDAGEVTSVGNRGGDPNGETNGLSEPDGDLGPYSCPSCGGSLWMVDEGPMLHYQCRIGHAFAVEGLVEAQAGSVDGALWAGVRALEERAALTSRIADRMEERGQHRVAARYLRLAADARARAQLIHDAVTGSVAPEGPSGGS